MDGKTLADLDVKPGDVVRCVDACGLGDVTVGGTYLIEIDPDDGEVSWRDDVGSWCVLDGSHFTIVSRAADQAQDKLTEAGARVDTHQPISNYENLARELQNYSQLKYMANCKCGDCAIVPLSVIAGAAEAIYDLSRATTAPAPEAASDAAREERRWPDGATEVRFGSDTVAVDHERSLIGVNAWTLSFYPEEARRVGQALIAAAAAMEARHADS